jgi:hypothetical protein
MHRDMKAVLGEPFADRAPDAHAATGDKREAIGRHGIR